MQGVRTLLDKVKRVQLVHGIPLYIGSLNFQTPIGPMENEKKMNYFLTMVKMYSSKSKINHNDI